MRATLLAVVLLACSLPDSYAADDETSGSESSNAASDEGHCDESGACPNGCEALPMFAVEVQMAEHTGLETLDAACNPALPEYLENAGGYRAMMMDLEVNAEPEGRAPAFYELLTTLCDPPFVGRYDVFRDSAPKVCVLSGAPAFGGRSVVGG